MNPSIVLDFVNLFFAGLLAGILFVIEYGVGRATAAVADEQSQLQMRQALILAMRVLVPVVFLLTILSGIAITVLDGGDAGVVFRGAGALVVISSFLLALFGTGRINEAILGWQPNALPKNWQATIARWQRLDTARTWAGMSAFALFLTAVALKLTVH